MKKLATLLLAAGLVFCGVTGASAVDFKAKGQWIMSFDYGAGYNGTTSRGGDYSPGVGSGLKSFDNFSANQRVRLQLDAVASESLSGTVYFEIGESQWGEADGGAALGADQRIIELKQAYIDWVVPNTDLKVRMGIQGLGLPSYTTGGSQVFTQDVAGIVLSNKFNDNIAATFFWARPYNDNYASLSGAADDANGYLDNVDVFGLVVPMTFDGFAITPWITYMNVAQNAYRGAGTGINGTLTGLLPFNSVTGALAGALDRENLLDNGTVFHVGLTGEITAGDPFRLAWDLNYGMSYMGYDDSTKAFFGDAVVLYRRGFYGSLLAEYKMDWGTPGLYFWYSTGDDDDLENGSERMPTINNGNSDNGFSNFAGNGNPYIAREGVLGNTLIGTWGIGLRVKDFSFVEDLKHTFRVNYFGGTNSTSMAKNDLFNAVNATSSQYGVQSAFGQFGGMYLTTTDSAWEFGLSTDYQIYDNLKLYVEMAYLVLDYDEDTWKDFRYTATDAWNINASFVYSF